MRTTMDEIYKILSWDSDDTTQLHGIQLASEENLELLFQPIRWKSAWENCAKVICQNKDERLQPYLPQMLEWLQDMNWPGADMVFDRLIQMPEAVLCAAFCSSLEQAVQTEDISWQLALHDLVRQRHGNQI